MNDRDKEVTHPDHGSEKAGTVIRILAGHTVNHLAQPEKIVGTSTA